MANATVNCHCMVGIYSGNVLMKTSLLRGEGVYRDRFLVDARQM